MIRKVITASAPARSASSGRPTRPQASAQPAHSACQAIASATSARSVRDRSQTNSSGVWAPAPSGPSPSIVNGIEAAKCDASLAPPREQATIGLPSTCAAPASSELVSPELSIPGQTRSVRHSSPTSSRVAGTAEFNGYNRNIRAERIDPLIAWCREHFPGMSTRQAVPWAGLRPMMPDMLPRVQKGRDPRVLYNTGHGHLGWTLSAATADSVAVLATAKSNQ